MNEEKINIEIESNEYDFVIKSGEVDDLKIVLPRHSSIVSELENNKNGVYNLRIYDGNSNLNLCKQCTNCRLGLNPFSKKVKIIIPDGLISNLYINLNHGKLFLKDLILDRTQVRSISGNVNMSDCHSESTSISGIKTNVSLTRVNGEYCSVSTVAGNLGFVVNDIDECYYQTEAGDIKAILSKTLLKKTTVYISEKNIFEIKNGGKKLNRKLHFTSNYGNFKSSLL